MKTMFTDNEIIKALACMLGLCNNDMAYVLDCRGCAFEGNPPCDERCSDGMAKAALSLINRQKAEIERLDRKLTDAYLMIDKLRGDSHD